MGRIAVGNEIVRDEFGATIPLEDEDDQVISTEAVDVISAEEGMVISAEEAIAIFVEGADVGTSDVVPSSIAVAVALDELLVEGVVGIGMP